MKSPTSLLTHPTLQLLQKCKTLKALKQVHAQMIPTGLALHTYPLSRLLIASSTLDVVYALSIFSNTFQPTIFLFNTLILSFANHKQHAHIAFCLYKSALYQNTVKPNTYTYPSLFKACGFHPWIQYGLVLHTHVLKFLELPCDHFVQASLLNYYANCGKLSVARCLFDRISKPDLATWNSILAAYARNACNQSDDVTSLSLETLCLFSKMQNSEIRPNEVTLVALISSCANLGALTQGAWAHVYILKNNNLKLNRYVGTALTEMYSKCGCLDVAYQLFDQMSERDTMCYNSMLGGFAIHGYGQRGLDLYEKMKLEGLVPDNVTFIVTMSACSHVGLVEDGCKIFESIKEVYGVEPTLEHYGCIVDLLSRAGRFTEAEDEVKSMPMKPNAIIWRSLLAGARVHGNLAVGEFALKQLLELEPETSGSYVLLSNMYASNDKWEEAKKVRKLMKAHGIIKRPGSSLVEIDGSMHEFITGDKTHPLSAHIYSKLEEINRRLHEYGYKPKIKEVLFDIEEEEKQDALSCHSERLAVAFALMATDYNSPIRIIKNLRICEDCHASTKLVSLIYGKEIIVRDRTRFHHFKDGDCSCLDYW